MFIIIWVNWICQLPLKSPPHEILPLTARAAPALLYARRLTMNDQTGVYVTRWPLRSFSCAVGDERAVRLTHLISVFQVQASLLSGHPRHHHLQPHHARSNKPGQFVVEHLPVCVSFRILCQTAAWQGLVGNAALGYS